MKTASRVTEEASVEAEVAAAPLKNVFEFLPLLPVDMINATPADIQDPDGQILSSIVSALSNRDFQTAILVSEAHLKKYPQNPHLLNFRGALSLQAGDPKGSAPYINRALSFAPMDVRIVNNAACVQILSKNYLKGFDLLHRCDSGFLDAECYYNMALAVYKMGDLGRTGIYLSKSRARGDVLETDILYAITYVGDDEVFHALELITPWLKKRPGSVLVQYFLGLIYFLKAETITALPLVTQCAAFDPDNAYYAGLFTKVMRYTAFDRFHKNVAAVIARIAQNPSVNTANLENAWKTQMQFCGPWEEVLHHSQTFNVNDAEKFVQDFEQTEDILRAIACSGISHILIRDEHLERVLLTLRHLFLDQRLGRRGFEFNNINRSLMISIARQCAMNEYVYFATEDEKNDVAGLYNRLKLPGKRNEFPRLKLDNESDLDSLVVLLCYGPLSDYMSSDQAKTYRDHPALGAFVKDQIDDPARERALMSKIPVLTRIQDEVSKKVTEMYMENPYPRWTGVNYGGSMDYLGLAPAKKDRVQVLVAGCGTGHHALIVGLGNKNCQVTAIDLSLASLAYARRKTEEIGITNIDYAQADILEIGSWKKKFDAIESVGVLHHLADPLKGLDILLGLLKPGGSMMLGLYSETARRSIVAGRGEIAARGIVPTADQIQAYRHEILSAEPDHPAYGLLSRGDFYTMSTCRDLIFHVQETRYTLPQISKILADRGLVFKGFNIDFITMDAFSKLYPDPEAKLNLDFWHAFEQTRPATFNNMYQFRVEKPL